MEPKTSAEFREEVFCREYIKRLQVAKSAIKAGYSPHSAEQIGSELLSRPRVQTRIAELLEERRKRFEPTEARIIEELSVIVYSRFDDFGALKKGLRLPDIDDLLMGNVPRGTDSTKKGSKGSQVTDNEEDEDDDFNVPLDILQEYQKVEYKYVDFELTEDIDPKLIPAIQFIKQGRNGIELKLHDKTPAIQLMMRYLGLLKDNLKITPGLDLDDATVTFE
jgi:phage terminase small subunit